MEPLDPDTRRAILAANRDVTAEDIDEYESLLARRFEREPDPRAFEPGGDLRGFLEPRLWELYRKLFPRA